MAVRNLFYALLAGVIVAPASAKAQPLWNWLRWDLTEGEARKIEGAEVHRVQTYASPPWRDEIRISSVFGGEPILATLKFVDGSLDIVNLLPPNGWYFGKDDCRRMAAEFLPNKKMSRYEEADVLGDKRMFSEVMVATSWTTEIWHDRNRGVRMQMETRTNDRDSSPTEIGSCRSVRLSRLQ